MDSKKKKALGEIVVFLLSDTLILIGANQLFNYIAENELDYGFLFSVLITILQIASIFVILLVFKDKEFNLGFSKSKIWRQFLYGVLLFAGMLIIYKLFGNSNLGQPFEINSIMALMIWDAFTAATTEELAYRGLLFTRFRQLSGNTIVAVLFSSVLFGASHFMVGDLQHIIMSSVTGCLLVLARAYLKHCTLVSTMIAHFLYDYLMCYIAI